jgi:RNA polymerase sigma-70 factor (ECF subfamily)
MARVRDGDLSALGILYDRHRASVRAFVARASWSDALADDITQEAFLKLASMADRYDGRESARPLLLGIAAKQVADVRRRSARSANLLHSLSQDVPPVSPTTPEREATNAEALRRVHAALQKLSPEKRIVILLVEGEGFTGQEAAEALGIPLGTVWTRLHTAREALRHTLDRLRGGDAQAFSAAGGAGLTERPLAWRSRAASK